MNFRTSHNKKLSDQELVTGIKKGGTIENDCLTQLYKDNYRSIVSFVLKNNGNEGDGKEMLQNAIIVLYEKIKEGTFTLNAKLSTFLFAVSKNAWFKELKKESKEVELDSTVYQMGFSLQEESETKEAYDHKKHLVVSMMNQLKPDCKQMLLYSIYQNYSVEEITDLMEFKNEQITRNKKYKCLRYLKNLVCGNDESNLKTV